MTPPRRATRSGTIVALGFVLALVVLGATGTFAALRLRSMMNAGDWAYHTWDVLRQTEGLIGDLNAVESSQRGYLLTGSEDALPPYDSARSLVQRRLVQLKGLVADNPSQRDRIARLEPIVQEHLGALQRPIDLRRGGDEEQARSAFAGVGVRRPGEIREIIAAVEAEEADLLARRLAAREWQARLTYLMILAGTTLAVLLAAGSAWALVRLLQQRAEAARALRESDARLIVTLSSIGDAVIATDVAGRVVFMNPIAEKTTGWNESEARGRHLDEVFVILNEHSRLTVDHPVEKVLRSGAIVGLANHTVLVNRDGTELPIDDSAAPIRDGDGEIMGVVLVFRDVTQRKEAQRARERYLAAEAANESKDRFLAVLSHELRSPLNAMLGWLRVLQTSKGSPEILDRAVQVLDRNIAAQTRLINDLLDMSRVVSDRLTLDFAEVDLGAFLRDQIESLRPAAAAKEIRIEEEIPTDRPLWVRADPYRLAQIVGNLLDNALKFTPKGGTISLTLDREAAHARIRVRDNGYGIDPEFLPFVFERFRQADSSSSRAYGGLGIGLAIVRHLVIRHEGTVVAASDGVGRGATFTVRLPLIEKPAATVAGDQAAALDGGPLSVLLVEDDADTLEALTIAFQVNGAKVFAARGAREAAEVLSRDQPNVILSDISMPGGDGYELIRTVRSGAAAAVPAIAMTGHASHSDRAAALEAGFDDYVAKPVDPEVVLGMLRSWAGTGRQRLVSS